MERVRLDLVDGRRHVLMNEKVHHAVGLEVAHADRSRSTIAVQLLHRTPRAVHVAVGLVDQVEVDVVEAEAL